MTSYQLCLLCLQKNTVNAGTIRQWFDRTNARRPTRCEIDGTLKKYNKRTVWSGIIPEEFLPSTFREFLERERAIRQGEREMNQMSALSPFSVTALQKIHHPDYRWQCTTCQRDWKGTQPPNAAKLEAKNELPSLTCGFCRKPSNPERCRLLVESRLEPGYWLRQ